MAKTLTATQAKNITAYNTHLEGVIITQSNQIGHMWSFMQKIQTHDETSDIRAKLYHNTVPIT